MEKNTVIFLAKMLYRWANTCVQFNPSILLDLFSSFFIFLFPSWMSFCNIKSLQSGRSQAAACDWYAHQFHWHCLHCQPVNYFQLMLLTASQATRFFFSFSSSLSVGTTCATLVQSFRLPTWFFFKHVSLTPCRDDEKYCSLFQRLRTSFKSIFTYKITFLLPSTL